MANRMWGDVDRSIVFHIGRFSGTAVDLFWGPQPLAAFKDNCAVGVKKCVIVLLPSPTIAPMLWSLIFASVLLTSQTMAQNCTYSYLPGFFVQDDPEADPNKIGAVSKMWLLESPA